MRKFVGLSLAFSVSFFTISLLSQGGNDKEFQYNNNGSFAGTSGFTWSGSGIIGALTGYWLQNRPNDYLNQNGAFGIYSNSASNGVNDSRRDDTAAIGWNLANETTNAGNMGWIFESHCHQGTGCADAQNEAYYLTDDGNGHGVRALGIFQRHDGSGEVNMILRSNNINFWDSPQSFLKFSIGENSAAINVPLSGPSDGSDFLIQGGTRLLKSGSVGVDVGPDSGVKLGGGDGHLPVIANTNHFQTRVGTIEDLSGATRVGFGAGGVRYPTFSNVLEGVQLSIGGSAGNASFKLVATGSGDVELASNTGLTLINTNGLKVLGKNGINGTCPNGWKVTEYTFGIATAGSCIP